jgi:hypothetical protein
VFLGGFDIEHDFVSIVPSKRVYVEKLLADISDSVVCQIARELGIEVPNSTAQTARDLQAYLEIGGLPAARDDFERAMESVDADPAQAIASSSSTLESICKEILDRFGEDYPSDESLQPLLKVVFKQMGLSPDGHADPDIKRILGGLLSAAVGIGVLRTKFSSAHGRGRAQHTARLAPRHARMAVHATSTIGLFLIETYAERFSQTARPANKAANPSGE